MRTARIAILVVALLASPTQVAAKGCESQPTRLSDWLQARMVAALVQPVGQIDVELLSYPGCQGAMLSRLQIPRKRVIYADNRVGYVALRIPESSLYKVLEIAGVEYIKVSDVLNREAPPPVRSINQVRDAIGSFAIPVPTVALSNYGKQFYPAEQLGVAELRREVPEGDGRGVKVAWPDGGYDVLHPALQLALDKHGKEIPKLADIDWIGVDDRWLKFDSPTWTSGLLMRAGRTWKVPKPGNYRFAMLRKSLFLSQNGPTPELDIQAGVLWSDEGPTIWVDTNADGDFSDERPLKDYGTSHEFGWFGSKSGAQDDRIAFVPKLDSAAKAAILGFAAHHNIMGAFSNRRTGGLYDGAAPAAQIIDIRWGYSRFDAELNLWRALARSDVDVVSKSAGDGGSRFDHLVYDRMIGEYKKPQADYLWDPRSLRVLEYYDSDTLERNVQVSPPYGKSVSIDDDFFPSSGVVNGVLIPSGMISTIDRYGTFQTDADGTVRGLAGGTIHLSPAPPGYSIDVSKSGTIPNAAGLLADLISAARSKSVRYNNVRLLNAIFTSADLVPGLPTDRQQHGLANAMRAFRQLVDMTRVDDPASSHLTSFAAEIRQDQKFISAHGYYEDSKFPGSYLHRDIYLTRVGGYKDADLYTLGVKGDDGTFSFSKRNISFARNQRVRIPFGVRVRAGRHLSFLQLRNRRTNTIVQEIPFQVRGIDTPNEVSDGIESYRSSLQPLELKHLYVGVDSEVQAVQFKLQLPELGRSILSQISVPGKREASGFDADESAYSLGSARRTSKICSLIANLEERTSDVSVVHRSVRNGIATVDVSNRAFPHDGNPHDHAGLNEVITGELEVSKFKISMSESRGDLNVRNYLAPANGVIKFYQARKTDRLLNLAADSSLGQQAVFIIRSPEHWIVNVKSLHQGELYDAYLLDCTSTDRRCRVATWATSKDGSVELTSNNPTPGKWIVAVFPSNAQPQPQAFRVKSRLLFASGSIPLSIGHGETKKLSLQHLARRADFAAFDLHGQDPDCASQQVEIAMSNLK